MLEKWRDVVGYEGYYQISNMGRIRSVSRKVKMRWGAIRRTPSKLLSPGVLPYGHCVVNLCKNNRSRMRSIHRLVLEAFVGPCPDGMEACHNNGDPTDNHLENLRWDTHRNNQLDMLSHGTGNFRYGKGHQNAKSVLWEKSEEIYELYSSGKYTLKQLGDLFGVCRQSILNVYRREKNKRASI